MGNNVDNGIAIADSALGVVGAIPGVGEVLNGVSAVTHGAAAVYDGFTGDRDGAINHGVQAAYGAVGAIPVVSEAIGTVDAVASGVGLAGRIGMAATGNDPGAIPGGIGDALGGGAVALTNALFGPDDSNWIADGTTPQGDKRAETAMGSLPGLLAAAGGGLAGLMGSGSTSQGLGEGGPTSGARGANGEANGWAQSAGDWMNNAPGNAMRWLDSGVRGIYGM